MLIVTRRIGESLKIGQLEDILEGPVTVTVLGMKGNQVRIGIDAQRNMRVDREEIRRRIDAELARDDSGQSERMRTVNGNSIDADHRRVRTNSFAN